MPSNADQRAAPAPARKSARFVLHVNGWDLTRSLGVRRGVLRLGPELEAKPAAEERQRTSADDKRHDLARCWW
jgi:hypothetical protein